MDTNSIMMNHEAPALTVSQLNRQVRSWLEYEIGEVSVLGEISSLSRPSSGHWYFTLKDENAQLRCVFFKNSHTRESLLFDNGQQVIARGKLSLYEARGDYQLIINQLSAAGIGALYQQFERLKSKLAAEGLFAEHRKKALPRFPATIGIITSPSGAALRDILCTLARRFPLADVFVYPCEVQGKTAAQQLIRALIKANEDARAEVLLLARGGGSIEDLWCFNDEQLAYAIARSKIPVISGVGHETDFTIADFVADLRTATPTAAAESVTPDKQDLLALLSGLFIKNHTALRRSLQQNQLHLSHHLARLTSPRKVILNHWQTLDYLDKQLKQCIKKQLSDHSYKLDILQRSLGLHNPEIMLDSCSARLQYLLQQLDRILLQLLNEAKLSLTRLMSVLYAVSPLATLERGYAIASCDDHVLLDSQQVHEGDIIRLRLAKGQLNCSVIEKVLATNA